MTTKPDDATILNNMVDTFDSLLKDMKKYGITGKTRHDGPVLYTSRDTTNAQHLIYMLDHFVKVWRRAASKFPLDNPIS